MGKKEGRQGKAASSLNLKGLPQGTDVLGKSGRGGLGKLGNVVCVLGKWVNAVRPLGWERVICKAIWGCRQEIREGRGATEGSEDYNRLSDLKNVKMKMTKTKVKKMKIVNLLVLATQKMK